MSLPDAEHRFRALTELDESLVVEAAAGTGKTSLLAGRVAMLLANGREPSKIAAITFTELAAAELANRVRNMLLGLARGGDHVPKVLRAVVPDGLMPSQVGALHAALERLDDLTVSTIHGFCQRLIKAYSVEAGVDPGAKVLDESQADGIFEDAFHQWLGSRLGEAVPENSPVAVMAREQPRDVVDTLIDLGQLRRHHRSARPPEPEELEDSRHDFLEAARILGASLAGVATVGAIAHEVSELWYYFENRPVPELDFASLWAFAAVPRKQLLMLPKSLCWKDFPAEGVFLGRREAAENPSITYETARELYEAARSAFTLLMGRIAAHLVSLLSDDLDSLLQGYASRKKASAALDFDDLLLLARDLLRARPDIASELGCRFEHLLVDEFQDTDPVQAEIVFRLAAEAPSPEWQNVRLRRGSLFVVGDPKQAIYRFRGADIEAYEAAKAAVCRGHPSRLLTITANFRSQDGILAHVNGCFESVLKREHGQPDYVKLASAIGSENADAPCVARLFVAVAPQSRAGEQRDAEAQRVAELCSRLIGAVQVRRADESRSPLLPGDIALLAPGHTDLWRYERALERQGLSVASQAGKGLMLRQETLDLLVLARTLADPLDTLAFGALLRGPLVGLTDTELLDIEAELRSANGWIGSVSAFSIRTDAALVSHPLAAAVLRDLQLLRRRSYELTPRALLSEAVERLQVRVVMALRSRNREARAMTNVDAILELARGYSVRGLGDFVRDLQEKWSTKERVKEGRSDADEHAIELVTFHSSKGLEWPVVIPINAGTQFQWPKQFLHRRSDDSLHWALGGIQPPGLELARREQRESEERERARVWYVACTRARDLLILPWVQADQRNSWSTVLNLGQERLQELDLSTLPPPVHTRKRSSGQNNQTASKFAAEAEQVRQMLAPVHWRRPSDRDPDRIRAAISGDEPGPSAAAAGDIQGSRARGVLLHALMEDLLTGRVPEDEDAVRSRATVLANGMGAAAANIDLSEVATTALATLALPEIAALRPHLVPEMPIYGRESGGALIAARADAVSIKDGRINAILDWKSDVDPSAADRAAHAAQVAEYVQATGAQRGAVVYMTGRNVTWVRERSATL